MLLHAMIQTFFLISFFFQAEDGIRRLVRYSGLGVVYKRQGLIPGINANRSDMVTGGMYISLIHI